jgi:hypothetical protein
MQYPHWLIVAGAVLVVLGFIGFVFSRFSTQTNEPANERSTQPSDRELISKVAGTLQVFIDQEGLDEFAKDRLSVVIMPDFRVSVSEAQFARGALTVVPLKDLRAIVSVLASDPSVAIVTLDLAAREVVKRIQGESS